MTKESETIEVTPLGRTVHLDETRLVFVGQVDGDRHRFFIGFRNEHEESTKLVLSREAFDALVWLYENWDDSPHLKETFPSRRDVLVWRIADQIRWKAIENE